MRTARSRLGRLFLVLAAVGTLTLAGPGPAAAGGPTSVLLASPAAGAAAALYYADEDYDRLAGLLDLESTGSGSPDAAEPAPASAAGSPYVTATWLIHDVSVWRIDRIFLIGDDVWVVSETSSDMGPLTGDGMYPNQSGNAAARWHRPTDPAALTTLLAAYGLLAAGPADDRSGPIGAGPEAGPTGSGPAAVEPAGSAAPGWQWVLVGGLGGVVVGLAAGGMLGRRLARRAAPAAGPAAEPAPMLPLP